MLFARPGHRHPSPSSYRRGAVLAPRGQHDPAGSWPRTAAESAGHSLPRASQATAAQQGLRRQPTRLVDGRVEGGHRRIEVICPSCGDHPDLDYSEVSPWLQSFAGRTRSRRAWRCISSSTEAGPPPESDRWRSRGLPQPVSAGLPQRNATGAARRLLDARQALVRWHLLVPQHLAPISSMRPSRIAAAGRRSRWSPRRRLAQKAKISASQRHRLDPQRVRRHE